MMDEGCTKGFALSYVDDFIVMGQKQVANAFLAKLASTWKCASPTWVVDTEWRKFCGVEMKWEGKTLLVGQPDYAREIVSRHKNLALRSSPLPKIIDLELEEVIGSEDVRQCQTVIGELLWLATRTRPDLSFAVSWLGAKVTGLQRVFWSCRNMFWATWRALWTSLWRMARVQKWQISTAGRRAWEGSTSSPTRRLRRQVERDIKASWRCGVAAWLHGNPNLKPLLP